MHVTHPDVEEEEEGEEEEEEYSDDEETEDITTSSLHSIACEAIGNYTAMVCVEFTRIFAVGIIEVKLVQVGIK
jgi:hypothetical protein